MLELHILGTLKSEELPPHLERGAERVFCAFCIGGHAHTDEMHLRAVAEGEIEHDRLNYEAELIARGEV